MTGGFSATASYSPAGQPPMIPTASDPNAAGAPYFTDMAAFYGFLQAQGNAGEKKCF